MWSLEDAQRMMIHVADRMVASKDLLTQADKAVGDGDHGIGMARGFEAVRKNLEARPAAGLDDLMRSVGTTLLTTVGGAAGAIFGTFFKGGARNLAGRTAFDSACLADFLGDGLQAVIDRGKARPGDKTMVDALAPAADAARRHAADPLPQALAAAAAAASQGADATRSLVASVGKAKTLGPRSLGHVDPGALSVSILLQALSEQTQA